MTPILTESIRELNLKIENIDAVATKIMASEVFLAGMRSWLASATNGITTIAAKSFHADDEICIKDTCITQTDLNQFKTWQASQVPVPPVVTPLADPTPDPVTPPAEPIVTPPTDTPAPDPVVPDPAPVTE
jgi:hypothetical protein